MDVLSETMSHLCADITALRQARRELREALMHGKIARKAAVEEMCGEFAATRAQMRKKNSKERLAFLNHLRRIVNKQRQAMRADLSGARSAWVSNAV